MPDQPPDIAGFSHVRHWVFDLDNTLYPPEAALFDQIEARMTRWVADALWVTVAEANRLRRRYWRSHGTTLAGLMEVHGVDPGPYLSDVHDISMDHLQRDPGLAAAIAALPGRRIVYTNGTAAYARRVLAARGLLDTFHDVFGVEEAGFQPKPRRAAFEAVFAAGGVAPARAAMFEDDPRNLEVPRQLGMQTVLVSPDCPDDCGHIQHRTNDLSAFLSHLAPLGGAAGVD